MYMYYYFALQSNLNLNATVCGETGFHYACENGHLKIVENLVQKSIEFNINLNATTIRGKTGYDYAIENGHTKIVDMLRQKSMYLVQY